MLAKKKDYGQLDVLIGQGSKLEGTIRSEGSVRVEGSFVGTISAKGDITVGERGSVQADLQARSILIAGAAKGNVEAEQSVTLLGTGRLQGDLVAASIAVEQGGIFEGNSRMRHAEASASSAVKRTAASRTAEQNG